MDEQEVKIRYVSKCFASCLNCGETFDIYDNPKYKHFVCSSKCADEFQEKPEINIKNLGLFMAKFGEYPEADFCAEDLSVGTKCLLSGFYYDNYRDGAGETWHSCQITDDRWTIKNLTQEKFPTRKN